MEDVLNALMDVLIALEDAQLLVGLRQGAKLVNLIVSIGAILAQKMFVLHASVDGLYLVIFVLKFVHPTV